MAVNENVYVDTKGWNKRVEKLIREMANAYHGQRSEKANIQRGRIARGRSASSSAKFEELLARLIIHYLPGCVILLDTPLTLTPRANRSKKKTRTLYPDLLIIDKASCTLMGIIEAKIDLGYLDSAWTKKIQTDWRDIAQAQSLSLGQNSLFPRKSKTDRVSVFVKRRPLLAFVVVLTSDNDHNRRKTFKTELKEKQCFFVHRHPNDSKVLSMEEWKEERKKTHNDIKRKGLINTKCYADEAGNEKSNQKEWRKLQRFLTSNFTR